MKQGMPIVWLNIWSSFADTTRLGPLSQPFKTQALLRKQLTALAVRGISENRGVNMPVPVPLGSIFNVRAAHRRPRFPARGPLDRSSSLTQPSAKSW
jgi:hypothetical protein